MRPPDETDLFVARSAGSLRRDPPTWSGHAARGAGDHTVGASPDLVGPGPYPRHAAVLVPVIRAEGGEARLLFTERATGLRDHAGQIAFPGGKIDPGETPLDAALREAEEEIGLERASVRPLGYLDGYLTGTGFFIVPVVGLVAGRPTLRLNPIEVAATFEVPLAFVLDPGHHELHARPWKGAVRQYYAMPFGAHYIWGVTAGILRNFHERYRSP